MKYYKNIKYNHYDSFVIFSEEDDKTIEIYYCYPDSRSVIHIEDPIDEYDEETVEISAFTYFRYKEAMEAYVAALKTMHDFNIF